MQEKMRAEQSKFLARMDSAVDEGSKSGQVASSSDVEDDSEHTAEVVCSLCHDPDSKDPMSFLILLQVTTWCLCCTLLGFLLLNNFPAIN
jgi:hypothetical protein